MIYMYVYISCTYIYTYEQEASVCMCCVVKINKKQVCLTNFRILLILSHLCQLYIYIYIHLFGNVFAFS